MKRGLLVFFAAVLVLFSSSGALAIPTQYGDSGLLSQPTADTLNAGNICLGLWGNYASSDPNDATIVPVSMTLGLGTFLEAYGSYPNLLFNDDELESGRGYANIGFKMRVLGKRSSPFKVAIDGQGRRFVSDNPDRDGLTDYLGRVIASFKPGRFGIHANAGYLSVESPDDVEFEDQYVLGGGIELYPTARLRLIAEVEAQSEREKGRDDLLEGMVGFQYFISPHLTINMGFGAGFTDESPDWRALVGFSTCQGVGTYSKPIPKLIEDVPEEEVAEEKEPVKKIKVRTLTPLIPKARKVPVSPVSKLEVPVEPNKEEVLVKPSERLVIPETEALKALPVSPVGGAPSTISGSTIIEEPILTLVYRKFRLPEFTFGFNQWSLSEEGRKTLSEVAEQLRKESKWFVIRVDGHTDSVGSQTYNEKLSLKRATSAATHLVLRDGFDPARMFVRGVGEEQPVAANDTPEGRAENRRIELLILVPKKDQP